MPIPDSSMVEQPAVKKLCIREKCGGPLTGRQKRFCSKRCNWLYNAALYRRNMKGKAVEWLGGRCQLCDYDRCIDALIFHHVKGKKKFGIGFRGLTRRWDVLQNELSKCILVCANCHAEIHAGLHDDAALLSNEQWKTG
jgi:hypothetical protein